MTLKNLLFICFMFIFITACTPERSDMTEPQAADSAEASGSAQDVAGEHSDEESDGHSDEEGTHGAEDADQHGHEDEHERRELGAHEHGAAELMIAWSGSDVAIDLETPAYNILGFEYAPTSDEEKALLEEAVAALETGKLLQLSPDAGCTVVSANVQTSFSEEGHDEEGHHEESHDSDEKDHHDDEGHHEEGHDSDEEGHHEEGHESDEEGHHDEEGHDSDEEGHHEEGHGEEGHGEETHSDVGVSYNLECQAPENIESLDASNLFAQFPNFEDIQVQWISDTQQSAADLTPDNPVLAFK